MSVNYYPFLQLKAKANYQRSDLGGGELGANPNSTLSVEGNLETNC